MGARPHRDKMFADTNESGYVWIRPYFGNVSLKYVDLSSSY